LVCTDLGDILLIEGNGDFKMMVQEAPGPDFRILNIKAFSKGFLLAGENAKIIVYEKTEEVKNPYTKVCTLPVVPHSTAFDDTNIRRTGIFSPKLLT